jgi:hypothetical protein
MNELLWVAALKASVGRLAAAAAARLARVAGRAAGACDAGGAAVIRKPLP